ncbi:MAG TPA: FAD-dependent monooxygenase [Gaiellaceae bacterium]|nr:FAD-dependent monooxygenase [Gaiellaceae bacterium]
MSPSPLRVAIVGGGIGGLTAAVALARHGVRVQVLEQAPQLGRVGASIDLGPNAVRLLDALGIEGARRVGVRPDAIELLRWSDGSVLLRTPHGAEAEAAFGAPLLDFFRPELHRALLDELEPGTLALGARVTGVAERGGAVEVVLEDGRRIEVDGVVAADGIRSPLRQSLVGADDPVFSGTVVYRGIVPRAEIEDLHPDRVNRYWLGPRRHAVSYWMGAGELLAVNLAVQEAEWAEESWTNEAETDEALAYFEGWHEGVLTRVQRCTTLLRGAVFVRRPLERWTFGRVTLLGDAAHAMEPFQAQGAAQAIEDAYVLGECLRGVEPDGVGKAFERYERIRTSRARELQASSSAAATNFYLDDGDEQRARDESYRLLHETHPWGFRQAIWEYDVRDALRAPAG